MEESELAKAGKKAYRTIKEGWWIIVFFLGFEIYVTGFLPDNISLLKYIIGVLIIASMMLSLVIVFLRKELLIKNEITKFLLPKMPPVDYLIPYRKFELDGQERKSFQIEIKDGDKLHLKIIAKPSIDVAIVDEWHQKRDNYSTALFHRSDVLIMDEPISLNSDGTYYLVFYDDKLYRKEVELTAWLE
jgi:hypothetical protein